jgi:hypothetical protein
VKLSVHPLLLCALLIAATAVLPARAVEVGGVIDTDAVWTPDGNPWVVTGAVTVVDGATLTLEAGVEVDVGAGLSLVAESGGHIDVAGEPGRPVLLRPRVAGEQWARIGATGASSRITMRHADVGHAQGAVLDGASGLFEACSFHDYIAASGAAFLSQPILVSNYADAITVRGCHFRNYRETLFRHGVITIEDSLFEDMTGDAVDFDYGEAGSVIRRCTFRHGSATNVDAVDLGSDTQGTEVTSCLIYDFPFDKGISIGEKSSNIVVRACVIYGVDMGIAIKDSSHAVIEHNTIVGARAALSLYEKVAGQGPGYAEARNNILWGNTMPAELLDGSVLNLGYSAVEGDYPGEGNLDVNPAFLDAAVHDYRLAATSPCIGAGADGATMGAWFPVGSYLVDTDGDRLPDTWETTFGLDPHNPADADTDTDSDGMPNQAEFQAGTAPDDPASALRLALDLSDPAGAALRFDAVAGKSYTLEHRDALGAGDWLPLIDIPAQPADTTMTIADPTDTPPPRRFYRLTIPAASNR